jgi:signal transduction histidine kinase
MVEDAPVVVLSVDDNEVNRYVVQRILTEAGFTVREAANGTQALQLAREQPDIVILDVNMPDIDGMEVCRRLKADPATASLMILQVSASAIASADRALAMETGADGFLVHPVEPRELIANVRALLRLRRTEETLRHRTEELSRAAEAKDNFLAMLGHELRNPLAPILNAVEVLREAPPGSEPFERACHVVGRQTRHLSRLVDDLLDVSRITHGNIELRLQPVELNEAVRQAVETSQPLIAAQHHALELSPAPGPVYVAADPTRLEQVLTNLVNNAVKYTPSGGRIGVSVEAEAAPEGALPGHGMAVVRVRDTGRGISPDMLPRVFDLFTQADPTIDRSQGGLGLGLTLVRRLVEMHGGSVSAASAGADQGSEFTVRLPAWESGSVTRALEGGRPAPPGAAPTADAQRLARGKRVLVVEDNDDSRETMTDLLTLWGHEVATASDGVQAVDAALALQPEVALIDIGLPGLDGYEVARRLRADGRGKALRLVALTGYGQPEDRARALEAGFDEHLVKPVEPEALSRLLAE